MFEIHFLRPWWLLGLLGIYPLIYLFWRHSNNDHSWQNVCDPHLLPHLTYQSKPQHYLLSLLLLAIGLLITLFTLAGPSWSHTPQPLYRYQSPQMIVLDVSEAMLAQDLKPDRLSRAKFKLLDLLPHLTTVQAGLVVFTAEPFTVSPLTQDAITLSHMIPELETALMPVLGSNIAAALQHAATLIQQAGYSHGNILLLTASTPQPNDYNIAATLKNSGITTNVFEISATSALANELSKLATKGGGKYIPFTANNDDITKLISTITTSPHSKATTAPLTAQLWLDQGRYFILLLLPLLLLLFRRGAWERLCG